MPALCQYKIAISNMLKRFLKRIISIGFLSFFLAFQIFGQPESDENNLHWLKKISEGITHVNEFVYIGINFKNDAETIANLRANFKRNSKFSFETFLWSIRSGNFDPRSIPESIIKGVINRRKPILNSFLSESLQVVSPLGIGKKESIFFDQQHFGTPPGPFGYLELIQSGIINSLVKYKDLRFKSEVKKLIIDLYGEDGLSFPPRSSGYLSLVNYLYGEGAGYLKLFNETLKSPFMKNEK